MKVTYTQNRFEIDGVEIINPEVLKGSFFTQPSFAQSEKDYSFDIPDNLIAEKEEIDTVEDGGGCYVAGSKEVYRLKLKEPLVEQFGVYRKDRDDEVPMKPVINELYADNGALCGYSLIDPLSGETLWTDDEEPLVDTGSKELIPLEKVFELLAMFKSFENEDNIEDVKEEFPKVYRSRMLEVHHWYQTKGVEITRK